MSNADNSLDYQIAKLTLKAGDVLVVKSCDRLSKDSADRIRTLVAKTVPSNPILVLDGGIDLTVIETPSPVVESDI